MSMNKRVNVRLDEDVWLWLESMAKPRRADISQVIREVLLERMTQEASAEPRPRAKMARVTGTAGDAITRRSA